MANQTTGYEAGLLDDDELADVNGGIGYSDVSGSSEGCGGFLRAAGAQCERICGNCFYCHHELGKTYCSHPHFGR